MTRTKIATSHDGQYSYWLDSKDRYIYQRRESDTAWCGWLCTQDAWERTFSVSMDLGTYSEYDAACDRAVRLEENGWRLSIDRAKDGSWNLHGYAPDMTAAMAQRGTLHYQPA